MQQLRLEEVTVDAVIAKLRRGWSDRIGQINAEKNDGIVCDAPDYESYYPGRMQQLGVFPAVFVLAGPTKFREQGAHSMTTQQNVYVWVCERGESGPVIARRLLRQVRAVVEVLYDDAPQEAAYVAGSESVIGPYRLFPKETRPGPVFQPEGQQTWNGSTLIVLTAEQEEI